MSEYDYRCLDSLIICEYEYTVYNMQLGMYVVEMSRTVVEYSANKDFAMRFFSYTLAEQLARQLEDSTKECHITVVEV